MSATKDRDHRHGCRDRFGFEWQIIWEQMFGAEHCVRPWQAGDVQDGTFPVRYAAPVDIRLLPEKLQSHPAWTMPWKNAAGLAGWPPRRQSATAAWSLNSLRGAAVLCASGAPEHTLGTCC